MREVSGVLFVDADVFTWKTHRLYIHNSAFIHICMYVVIQ